MFRKPHLKLLRRFSVHPTNNVHVQVSLYGKVVLLTDKKLHKIYQWGDETRGRNCLQWHAWTSGMQLRAWVVKISFRPKLEQVRSLLSNTCHTIFAGLQVKFNEMPNNIKLYPNIDV